ncbi:MAG: short-chain dehydrogenase [Pseudonocardiales bacterium]|nr:MAG: short-chain dehydrogenase [Pseudonocardiales bacterium]
MTKWTAADIADQTGRRFVVTGANSGLGASTARELARVGASVVLACRNTRKGSVAAASMPGKVEVRQLDLADLASVRSFAQGLEHVDVLVNNAGIMAVPKGKTANGFESQVGTNHLGHFLLTGLLLPKITDRVVTLSSYAHRVGRINLADLNWERRRYQRWGAYGQSKLANLMFAYELQRRLAAAGSPVKSLAAHPGYASTELQSHTESFQDRVMVLGNRLMAQSADMGALPELYAATVTTLRGGEFVGPDGRLGMNGHPRVVGSSAASKDKAMAAELWARSEELTGVRFP